MRKLGTVLILLGLAGGAGYYYFYGSETIEPPQVVEATIAEGDVIEVVQATGTLEPVRTVPVGSQVSGIVKSVSVDFNDIVQQGQLIAEIDPDLLQVQVDLQQANVSRQEGEIANQEVQLEDARRQLERTQQLFDRQLTTQQALDQAVLTVKQRETSLDAARKQLITIQANLNQARLNVSYTKIYAPVQGVVVQRLVDPGEAVQASMSAPQFFEIATDLRELILTAGVDEAEIGKIAPGMAVNFEVDTYPQSTFTGRVEEVRLNATTQSNVVTYPVRISVPNPDLRLFPAMTASLQIVVRTAEGVVRVPNQATRFRPTNDMFLALGLEPPDQPQRALAAEGAGEGAMAVAAAPATAAPAATGNGQVASAARGQAALTGGGRGNGNGNGNGQAGGRGRNGRGGGAAAPAPAVELSAGKIDDLREPVDVRVQAATVWQWNGETGELVSKRVQVGVSDGSFSQLVSGELAAGDKVVTNIILPVTGAERLESQQNFFGQRGGFGGGRGR